jgi:hypothetical protein
MPYRIRLPISCQHNNIHQRYIATGLTCPSPDCRARCREPAQSRAVRVATRRTHTVRAEDRNEREQVESTEAEGSRYPAVPGCCRATGPVYPDSEIGVAVVSRRSAVAARAEHGSGVFLSPVVTLSGAEPSRMEPKRSEDATTQYPRSQTRHRLADGATVSHTSSCAQLTGHPLQANHFSSTEIQPSTSTRRARTTFPLRCTHDEHIRPLAPCFPPPHHDTSLTYVCVSRPRFLPPSHDASVT